MNAKFTPTISVGSGHRKVDALDVGGDARLPQKRIDPDLGSVPADEEPRLVVEVEISNRYPLRLAKHVHQLMTSWVHLRCVIGLKIYEPTTRGQFAAVCFVWKKGEKNSIFVERIFDVGPRPSRMTSKDAVAQFWREHGVDFTAVADDKASFEVKPLPQELECPLPDDCPDELKNHFTVVVVEQADVYHGLSETRHVQEKRLKYVLRVSDDARLEIDLYALVKRLEDLDAFSAD